MERGLTLSSNLNQHHCWHISISCRAQPIICTWTIIVLTPLVVPRILLHCLQQKLYKGRGHTSQVEVGYWSNSIQIIIKNYLKSHCICKYLNIESVLFFYSCLESKMAKVPLRAFTGIYFLRSCGVENDFSLMRTILAERAGGLVKGNKWKTARMFKSSVLV